MKELEERQEELERLSLFERSKMQVKVSEKEIRAYYESALLQEPQQGRALQILSQATHHMIHKHIPFATHLFAE
ncbi:MAG: hypothetical protein IJV87_09155 [Clostridia bacterium]|nr:hypothetical protein [Clostridia bacterium]